jgi:hypothetical protein
VRAALYGKDEHRQLADMRCSGFVGGDAGGASVEDGAKKGANTIDASNRPDEDLSARQRRLGTTLRRSAREGAR